MRKLTVFLTAFMLLASLAFSQKKVEADLGAGLWEGLSTKLKIGNNFQFGLCQGFLPGISPLWLTGAELYGHFGKESKFVNQRTFYIMGGMSTTLYATGYNSFEKIVFYSRIGRTVNFSAKTGINLDFGLGILSADDIDGYHSTVTPTLGMHFFVRL